MSSLKGFTPFTLFTYLIGIADETVVISKETVMDMFHISLAETITAMNLIDEFCEKHDNPSPTCLMRPSPLISRELHLADIKGCSLYELPGGRFDYINEVVGKEKGRSGGYFFCTLESFLSELPFTVAASLSQRSGMNSVIERDRFLIWLKDVYPHTKQKEN